LILKDRPINVTLMKVKSLKPF